MEKLNETQKEYREKNWGVKYLLRGPRVECGLLLLPKEKTLGKHMHKEVEEIFYFLEGEGIMLAGKEEFKITKGDIVRVEPQEAHDILCISDTPLRAIFIKSPYLPEDKISL